MKSAKEMFEELGYKQTITDTKYIYVSSYNNTIIEFDEIIVTVRISQIDKEYAQTFNMEELQAINKQVEELWGGNNA